MLKFVCFLGLVFAVFIQVRGIEITQQWVITCSSDAIAVEKHAAAEIQTYIRATTGMMLRIVQEGEPAIRIQHGDFAPEEWHVAWDQTGNLLISGGRPRGVLYAAYEFIEKVLGCRFLAPGAEYIPKLRQLQILNDLQLSGNPVYTLRHIFIGNEDIWQEQNNYMSKLKLNGFPYGATYGWRYGYGRPGPCHTFHAYTAAFPVDQTEFFSLDSTGKRLRSISGMGPGQICLSHPEVRKLVFKQMLQYIRSDRENLEDCQPAPVLYSFSKNDNKEDCVCENCLAVKKKYGGHQSGVQLELVNELARGIREKYPELLVQTTAYTTTEVPPVGIVPESNVLIEIAQLDSEFQTKVRRDVLRPLEHPNNAVAMEIFRQWAAISKNLMVWDYWRLYRDLHVSPYTNVSAIVKTLRTYRQLGIKHFFVESEIDLNTVPNFIDLRHYLGAKILENPDFNESEIIADFMEHYFGPAAPAMTAWLNDLEQRMAEEKRPFGMVSPGTRKYLKADFFASAERFFQEAEQAAAGREDILQRIGQERIPVDVCLLQFDKRMKLALDRDSLLARLRSNYHHYINKYVRTSSRATWKNQITERLSAIAISIPLPPQFADQKAFDFSGRSFTFSLVQQKVEDPEAADGIAVRFSDLSKIGEQLAAGTHSMGLYFCLHDVATKQALLIRTIPPDECPQDEKYHWYLAGKSKLRERTILAINWTWWVSQTIGDSVFDPLEPEFEYEIWTSVKLTGPSYAPGSQKPDAVYLDRVVFVEIPQCE